MSPNIFHCWQTSIDIFTSKGNLFEQYTVLKIIPNVYNVVLFLFYFICQNASLKSKIKHSLMLHINLLELAACSFTIFLFNFLGSKHVLTIIFFLTISSSLFAHSVDSFTSNIILSATNIFGSLFS